jgi:hypothetical protein
MVAVRGSALPRTVTFGGTPVLSVLVGLVEELGCQRSWVMGRKVEEGMLRGEEDESRVLLLEREVRGEDGERLLTRGGGEQKRYSGEAGGSEGSVWWWTVASGAKMEELGSGGSEGQGTKDLGDGGLVLERVGLSGAS